MKPNLRYRIYYIFFVLFYSTSLASASPKIHLIICQGTQTYPKVSMADILIKNEDKVEEENFVITTENVTSYYNHSQIMNYAKTIGAFVYLDNKSKCGYYIPLEELSVPKKTYKGRILYIEPKQEDSRAEDAICTITIQDL
jgi:hypothetical protein